VFVHRAASRRGGLGQHALRSPRLAAAIVEDAGVEAGELVLDLGAGAGRLTRELARRGARVWAIEVDPRPAASLRARDLPGVRVVLGDALGVSLPREPFRVVANPPFGASTAILRRLLDDPAVPLIGADLVLEWTIAVNRAAVWPSRLLNVVWGARFELAVVRKLPAATFDPPPAVDAAVLRIRPRRTPLVGDAAAFRTLVAAGFARPGPLRRTLAGRVPSYALKRTLRDLGHPPDAAARDLDVHAWATLFDSVGPTR
jgi:23S rRNA (adenine-N6)-dimethyltransferase